MPWWNRSRRCAIWRVDRAGNVAVEFALVCPVVLMLLAGIVDYGLAINSKMNLSSAVRAGLQHAMQDGVGLVQVEQSVLSALNGNTEDAAVTTTQICECPDGSAVDCFDTCPSGRRRTFIRIEASRPHATLMSWPGIESPTQLEVTARVRVR